MDPASVIYAALPPQITESTEATPLLRWVMRFGEQTLQQAWVVKTYTGGSVSAMRQEWRDVTTERE